MTKRRLEIRCYQCQKLLRNEGALLLGPPDRKGLREQYHLCRKCWNQMFELVFL